MNENLTNKNRWEEPTTIWNPMFLSIFFVNMALNMGQQMSNSLLSLYANSMGAPADQIGQLMSMFAVTALVFRFVSGPTMNSFSRKKLVITAMCFMAAAYMGFGFAPNIAQAVGLQPVTVLKGFRLLQGVGNAFGNSCCMTIVADTLPKDKFSTGMGYYACASVIAQSIGPVVGVFLRDTLGYHITYVINFVVMCSAIVVCSVVKIAPRERMPFNLKISNIVAKNALPPAIITFMINLGFTAISTFLLVYSEERGIAGASVFFTVYAVTLLITRPMIGRLTEKFGFIKVGLPSVLMTACSFVLIAYAPNLIVLLIAAFVNAFGYGAVHPMLQSLCMKSVPAEHRGSASSTNYIAQDLATILGPMLCGRVAKVMGYVPVMWLVMTVPIFTSMVTMFLFRKKIRKIEFDFKEKK